MAKFNFRQGIARRQEDGLGNPTFLQKNGTYINLNVSPDPTVFLIAHHSDTNYMFTENASVVNAWGPFTVGPDYWLYWDVSFVTGELTRGFTTREPIVSGVEPTSPALDQHWFDMNQTVCKRWDGSCWREVIRVFAAKYQNGNTIIHYPLGSQVGLGGAGQEHFAGSPLFDPDGKPLQIWQRDRMGRFITTETPLYSQFSRNANFRVEAAINQAVAAEPIPIHYAVAYSGTGAGNVMLARNVIRPADPRQAIGIASEDMATGEIRSFITKGFISSSNWNWTQPAGTRLFVGPEGQLTPSLSEANLSSIQEMGMIVDPKTVYVDPQPTKFLNTGSTQSGNYVPMFTDRTTGKEIMWDRTGAIPGTFETIGFVHNQLVAATVWTIEHNGGTEFVSTQVTDENGNVVIPSSITTIDDDTVEISFDDGASPAPVLAGRAMLVLFI